MAKLQNKTRRMTRRDRTSHYKQGVRNLRLIFVWLLLSLLPTAGAFLYYQGMAEWAASYERAPACTTVSALACRMTLDLTVRKLRIEERRGKGSTTSYLVTVQLPGSREAEYAVNRGFYNYLTIGSTLRGEYWTGEIREMTHEGRHTATQSNPRQQADRAWMWLILPGILNLWLGLTLIGKGVELLRARRAIADLTPPARPEPAPVVPVAPVLSPPATPTPRLAGHATRRLRPQELPQTLQLTPRHNEAKTRRLGAAPPLPRRVVR